MVSNRVRDSPLDNDVRSKIWTHVKMDPGISVKKLTEYTKLNGRAIDYHLRILERDGLVTKRKVAGRRGISFYPTGYKVEENPTSNVTSTNILSDVPVPQPDPRYRT